MQTWFKRLTVTNSFKIQVWLHIVPDLEEGVGNAHPNHALANQSSQTKGGNTNSPPRSEHGGDSGDDEEKSVLQVTLHWFASVCQKLNPRCRRSWPTWRSTLGTGGWPSPSSPSSSSSSDSPSTSSITRSVPFHPFCVIWSLRFPDVWQLQILNMLRSFPDSRCGILRPTIDKSTPHSSSPTNSICPPQPK